jgi:acetyltransferase-like isoleucine patch superfamily enzyme
MRTIAAFIFPTFLVRFFLNRVGWDIDKSARIGFSWVKAPRLVMGPGARIGHANFVATSDIEMQRNSYIQHANVIRGPFSIRLLTRAALGSRNVIVRARSPVSNGESSIILGELSKITSSHYVDLTQSIVFGDFSTLGGVGSQIWTHGYVHDLTGPGRYRIDGSVTIGNNVYIGAGTTITGGLSIADGAIIGAGSTIAKTIDQAGFYVSSVLRRLDRPADPDTRSDLSRVEDGVCVETVYVKREARRAGEAD